MYSICKLLFQQNIIVFIMVAVFCFNRKLGKITLRSALNAANDYHTFLFDKN